MKKILMLLLALILSGCASNSTTSKVIDYQKALELIDEKQALIVDVRTLDEYNTGHIENAILIPLDTITTEPLEQIPDLDAPIIVYCRSGNRSNQALGLLEDIGYSEVYDLGSINNWEGTIVK
ncbi:MAG: rhodanese-like domain-containing protein [Erysipelotrichaceae bacterium]|nr:rhodanese-like domain-containing protein [Erysipelotrichaceae bacterium]